MEGTYGDFDYLEAEFNEQDGSVAKTGKVVTVSPEDDLQVPEHAQTVQHQTIEQRESKELKTGFGLYNGQCQKTGKPKLVMEQTPDLQMILKSLGVDHTVLDTAIAKSTESLESYADTCMPDGSDILKDQIENQAFGDMDEPELT